MKVLKLPLRGWALRWGLLLLLAACAALLTPAPLRAGQPIDQVIASVDGEPITMHDLKTFGTAQGLKLPDVSGNLKLMREVLKALIEQKLLDIELKNFSDQVDDRAIDRYIGKILDKNHATLDQLKAEIAQHGVTWEKYRERIKGDLERAELLEHEVRQKIHVTPAQMAAYYHAHSADYTVTQERLKLAQILVEVAPDAPPQKVQEAKSKAEMIRSRALAGEDFGELARKYSNDDSAAKGGELGAFAPDEILDQVRGAVAKLDAGQVSQLVRTEHGFHILKVEEHERPGVRPLSEVREDIRAKLEEAALQGALKRWVDEDLVKSHHVESFL